MSASPRRLSTVVVTGGHPYDVAGFARLRSDLDRLGIATVVQELDDFVASAPAAIAAYDCVLFYFFPLTGPPPEAPERLPPGPRAVIEGLLDAGTGIVVLHHALLAYPAWDTWDGVVGATQRDRFTYHAQRRLTVAIADPGHEITRDVYAWQMTDETYRMPEAEGTPLLLVDHPDSMRCIAWFRRFRASRIVCVQSGHDADSWGMPEFQRVLARGIAWTASRGSRCRELTEAGVAPG